MKHVSDCWSLFESITRFFYFGKFSNSESYLVEYIAPKTRYVLNFIKIVWATRGTTNAGKAAWQSLSKNSRKKNPVKIGPSVLQIGLNKQTERQTDRQTDKNWKKKRYFGIFRCNVYTFIKSYFKIITNKHSNFICLYSFNNY